MPTEKQLAANRANARKSTGPRTPAGKARSAQNACKHGLRASRFCLLPSEDPQEFAQFAAAYHQEYCPQTPTEDRYLTQLITAAWKLDRLLRLEAGLFADACAFLPRLHPDEPAYAPEHQTSDSPAYGRVLHNALHATGGARDWDRYLRHQQALERSFARAEAALLRLRQQPPSTSQEQQHDYEDAGNIPNEPTGDVGTTKEESQPESSPKNEPIAPAAPRQPTPVPTLLCLLALLLLAPTTSQTNPVAALPPGQSGVPINHSHPSACLSGDTARLAVARPPGQYVDDGIVAHRATLPSTSATRVSLW